MNSDPDSIDVVVGIDAGGTSTQAVVVLPDGTCLAQARQSGGNPTSRGTADGLRAIVLAARQAVQRAGGRLGRPVTVRGCLLAMAGEPALIDVPRLADELGVEDRAVRIVGDVEAMYFAGTTEPAGTALVVGTGSVAARFETGAFAGAVGGAGWLLGDDGSGFWIGHRVARAVVADLSGLRAPTAMTAAVLAVTEQDGVAEPDPGTAPARPEPSPRTTTGPDRSRPGVADRPILGHRADLDRLIHRTYASRAVHLAALAPIAFAFAGTDPVAAAIVARAGRHITDLIGHFGVQGPLVVGGSVMIQGFLRQPQVAPELTQALRGHDLHAVDSGLAGAAFLALAQHHPDQHHPDPHRPDQQQAVRTDRDRHRRVLRTLADLDGDG